MEWLSLKKCRWERTGKKGVGGAVFAVGKAFPASRRRKEDTWPVAISSTVGLLVLFSTELSGDLFLGNVLESLFRRHFLFLTGAVAVSTWIWIHAEDRELSNVVAMCRCRLPKSIRRDRQLISSRRFLLTTVVSLCLSSPPKHCKYFFVFAPLPHNNGGGEEGGGCPVRYAFSDGVCGFGGDPRRCIISEVTKT